MTRFPVTFLAGLLAGGTAWAIYAPIAADDAPGAVSVGVAAGVSYDTNIFAAPNHAIGSTIFELAPRFAYQFSPGPQTSCRASYRLTLEYLESRPGEKLLDNHEAGLRAVHQFSPQSQLDVSDLFERSRHPAVVLNGLPFNTDQSLNRNQFDARYGLPAGPRGTLLLKLRDLYYDFDSPSLGRQLDRSEDLAGIEYAFSFLPTTKLVAEYRHQDVLYLTDGSGKNKVSDFGMAGVDYALGPRLAASARLGAEERRRSGEPDTTAPYAEATLRWVTGERSFFSAGYVYTLEETSDIIRFDDTRIHRCFVGGQRALSPLLLAAATVAVEPARLHGRRGQADVSETALRAGVQLNYRLARQWTISVTYDYDRVHSDEASRELRRSRAGGLVAFAF